LGGDRGAAMTAGNSKFKIQNAKLGRPSILNFEFCSLNLDSAAGRVSGGETTIECSRRAAPFFNFQFLIFNFSAERRAA
jgi:hypothetical protein